ncbi:hypothetical protein I4U23_001219 [Adineta vaga]|nr:hypothetical protein I4U23_001219 [Adineta vaga]
MEQESLSIFTYQFEDSYSECLRCQIHTLIQSNEIEFENINECLTIKLQCIQFLFDNQKIFEEFLNLHQEYIYKLFYKENTTARNTLHIILKEHQFKEINQEYIENYFPIEFQAYRVLFFEIYIHNTMIIIDEDLMNLTRLSIKIILNCVNNNQQRLQTIYIIHNQNISLESKEDFCSLLLTPLLTTTLKTSITELLLISENQMKDFNRFPILFTCFIFSLLLILYLIYYLKHKRVKSLTKTNISSESTVSLETPISIDEKPKVSLKIKPSKRTVRTIQLINDEI